MVVILSKTSYKTHCLSKKYQLDIFYISIKNINHVPHANFFTYLRIGTARGARFHDCRRELRAKMKPVAQIHLSSLSILFVVEEARMAWPSTVCIAKITRKPREALCQATIPMPNDHEQTYWMLNCFLKCFL